MAHQERLSAITSAVTQSAAMPQYTSTPLSQVEAEELRQEYLTIMQTGDHWLEHISEVLPSCVGNTVNVTLHGVTRALPYPFYIGRQAPPPLKPSHMAHLPITLYGSRCHVLCTMVDDKIILVDPGSLVGIKTVKRSLDIPAENSLPTQRQTLQFSKNEKFVLDIDGIKVGFNLDLGANECTVCMDAYCIERLGCGHCVACPSCLDRLHICPVCRAPLKITQRQMTFGGDVGYRHI
jgi:hypothetical protein